MRKQRNFVIGLIIVIILVAFALLNNAETVINFGFSKIKLPLVLILFICILLGALVTYLFATGGTYNLKKQIKHLNGELEQAQSTQNKAVSQAIEETTQKLDAQYQKELMAKDKQIKGLQIQANQNAQTKSQNIAPKIP